MHLEIREIKDGCLEQQYCCGPDEFPQLNGLLYEEQVRFADPICFRLRFQKSGQMIEVDGQLQTRVGLVCGRCLQPFETDLKSDFALTFTPANAAEKEPEAEEVELDADELGLIYYQDEKLDLLQPLQEQIIMALPLSPVCAESCLGLCPECGCDLNYEKCSCEKRSFNNKFSALAGLKISEEKTDN